MAAGAAAARGAHRRTRRCARASSSASRRARPRSLPALLAAEIAGGALRARSRPEARRARRWSGCASSRSSRTRCTGKVLGYELDAEFARPARRAHDARCSSTARARGARREGARRSFCVWRSRAAACGRDPAAIPAVGTLERDRIELVAEADEPIVEMLVREGDARRGGRAAAAARRRAGSARRSRAREAARDEARRAARRARARAARGADPRGARAPGRRGERGARTREREYERSRALELQGVRVGRARATSCARRATRRSPGATRRARRSRRCETGTTSRGARPGARARSPPPRRRSSTSQVRLERLDGARAAGRRASTRCPSSSASARPRAPSWRSLLAAEAPYARVYVPEPVRARIATGHARAGARRRPRRRVRRPRAHARARRRLHAVLRAHRSTTAAGSRIWPRSTSTGRACDALPTGVPVEVRFELEQSAEAARDERASSRSARAGSPAASARVVAVDHVDLEIPRAAIYGFLGPERLRQVDHDPHAVRPAHAVARARRRCSASRSRATPRSCAASSAT